MTKEELVKNFAEIKSSIELAEADLDKFVGGNSSAGARLRKAMQNTKVKAQDVRNGVTAIKNQ
jgi:hypothetical protein